MTAQTPLGRAAFGSARRFIDLLLYKAFAELRAEAERTYTGYAWWVVEPLIHMAIYYVVFGLFYNRGTPHFVPFLLIGLVVWHWFSSTLMVGSYSILGEKGLINQVPVPKVLFPAVTVITSTFKFLFVFLLLLIFLRIYGLPLTSAYLALALIVPLQLLMQSALTILAAAWTPFVPDLRVVLDNLLRGLFFLSGVFYPGSDVPARFQSWFYLNPITVLIESYRQVLLAGAWPDWGRLLAIFAVSLAGLGLGVALISRNEHRYPKVAA